MKTGYKVMDAMTKSPIAVLPSTTITKCSQIMGKEHVGGILVKKDSVLLGIITEQDIVRNIVAAGLDPSKTRVEDVMIKSVITVLPSDDVYDALVKMRDANIRHLPVIKDKALIGVLTIKDILKIQPQLFDLVVEKFNLREEDDKPVGVIRSEGICEVCSDYSAHINTVNGVMLCDACKAEQENQ